MAQSEPGALPEWQRAAYESTTAAVCVLSGDWKIIYLNHPAVELVGAGHDVSGRVLWDCLPEFGGGVFRRECQRAMADRVKISLCVSLDDRGRWYGSHICPREEGLTIFWLDITDDRAAQRALRESERRFRLLFENNPQPMLIWAVDDLRILDVNDCAVDAYGFTREEFLAMTVLDLRPESDIPAFLARALPPGNQASRSSGPWLHRKKDGTIFNVLITSQPTEYRGRRAKFVTMEDVTARLATESALRHAEARYRSLVEASAQIVWTSGPDGMIRPPVPDWTAFTGQSGEELRDNGWLQCVHPDDRERTRAAWESAHRSRAPYDIEHRIRKRSGDWADMHGRAVPVLDEAGEVREWIGIHTDVTARRSAERQLRESERQFRHVFTDCAIGIALVDTSTRRLLRVNPAFAAMLGYEPAGLAGQTFDEISHPDDLKIDCEHLERLEAGLCTSYNMEKRYLRKDGSYVWAELTVSAMQDEAGQSRVVLGMVEDISTRKALEAQLQQAQKMEAIGRLAGGIAHDFNNLLTVIIGHAGLMAQRAPEALAPSLDEVQKAAEHAAALTRQLLTFSRKQQPVLQTVDLNAVLSNMAGMLARLLGEDVRLDVETMDSPALARCDPNQMEQVILNLAVNARDAMSHGGALRLSVDPADLEAREAAGHGLPPGRYVRLRVSDTGHGMDEKTRARIFEPFFTTKPPGQGTGLGLSIAYAAIRNCSGAIEVDSRPGAGTTFEIHLPASDPAPIPAPRPESTAAGPAHGQCILLVEDEPGLRKFVNAVLSGAGYSVVEAGGPRAAMTAAAAAPRIDLLLSDVVMPDMSGPDLARELKKLRPELKVLLMSGYPEHGSLPEELECTYLQKPFTPADLLRLVAANLGG